MLILIRGTKRNVLKIPFPVGIERTDIVHVITNNANHICRQICINIAIVQTFVLVEMLLRHTQDSAHGLRGKGHALQFSEYQENGCTRTIPAQGYGLLEQQHLGNIIRLSDILKIRRFILAIVNIDILDGVQILHHLLLDTFIILIHLILIIRQLNKQQRIDAIFLVGISQFLSLFESLLQETLVNRKLRLFLTALYIRIQFNTLLNHLFIDYILAFHKNRMIALGDWCC